MSKITLLVGGAVGYVLGSKAGRQRYEQIRSQARTMWNNPKVQAKATRAQDFAKQKAPLVKDRAAGAAASAASATKHKVSGDSQEQSAAYPTSASTGNSTTGTSPTGTSPTGTSSTGTSTTGTSTTDPSTTGTV